MPAVYVTAPPEAAEEVARDRFEQRLTACVNRLDCQSTYRWNDAVHDDQEVVLLAKTTENRSPDLVDRVERAHLYDVPCIDSRRVPSRNRSESGATAR